MLLIKENSSNRKIKEKGKVRCRESWILEVSNLEHLYCFLLVLRKEKKKMELIEEQVV